MSSGRSDSALEEIARRLRVRLGIETHSLVDLMTVILKLREHFPRFSYLRCPDEELPDCEAQWDEGKFLIRLRESVFRAMQRQENRARWTVSHEIGHFVLGHHGIRNRSVHNRKVEYYAYEILREEDEAKRFAAIFLAPAYLIKDNETASEISKRFGLSLESATIRRYEVDELARRAAGKPRPLPAGAIDFLVEARNRGYKVKAKLD